MITAEYAPRAKAGGLADMVAGLSGALHRLGHDVRVLLPAYGGSGEGLPDVGEPFVSPVRLGGTHPPVRLRQQPGPGPDLYLVDCPAAFGAPDIYGSGEAEAARFALLAHAAGPLARTLGFAPHILHAHDWHTALVPLLHRSGPGDWRALASARSVFTIHNIGYQGVFPAALLPDLGLGGPAGAGGLQVPGEDHLNFLRAAVQAADALTTVSPTHATEILSPDYGMGLDGLLRERAGHLTGILNGADYEAWNPATDPHLPAPFSATDPAGKGHCTQVLRERTGLRPRAVPVAGMVTRLAAQKGIPLVLAALPEFLAAGQLQLVVLGAGDATQAAALRELASRFPGDCAFLEGHDEALARQIYGGSDLFLVPSLYEPCGLTQMYALRYGAVPVVRRTGGLQDTVTHFDPATSLGNGSVFRDPDPGGLRWGLGEALRWHGRPELWARLVANGMACDYSWTYQAPRYGELYAALLAAAGPARPAA